MISLPVGAMMQKGQNLHARVLALLLGRHNPYVKVSSRFGNRTYPLTE